MHYDENYVKNLLPKRPEISHKGTFGSVLNIAGSGYYSGAAYFSSVSALKVGCGKSTLASVQSVLNAVSSLCPDVILFPLQQTKENTASAKALNQITKKIPNYQAVSIGCGLSTNRNTELLFEGLIKCLNKTDTPVVIDADGLNILAILNKIKKAQLPQNTILTPHPLEIARLLDMNVESVLEEPDKWVKKCSEKFNCVTVLKLHETLIADNKDNFYKNNTGNSALSHAGSGDVLCGMITGFLAQGLSCFDAACLAVYLHGRAAQIASEQLTEYSVLASNLVNFIPFAIKSIL